MEPAGSRSILAGAASRYELIAALGHGGMGAVEKVFDTVSGEIVARKRLTISGDERHAQRVKVLFEREFHCCLNWRTHAL